VLYYFKGLSITFGLCIARMHTVVTIHKFKKVKEKIYIIIEKL
jgi:hypothetical protein